MQERYIAAADLGSSKIAISVAKVEGDDIEVIYYKEHPSDGIRHSCIQNPTKAGEALRKAIANAEEELRIKILQIVLGLPRYGMKQETSSACIDRSQPDDCITREEIDTLKSMALDVYPLDDADHECIYGAVAQSFSADDLIQQGEDDIIGVTADQLEGNFKVFVGGRKAVKNLDRVCNDLGIAPRKVFIPHSVAGCVLSEEEKENGVALVEMGAGVTSATIYQGHILRYYAAIPYGGSNITTDIKYEGGFDERLAENIKLAFGACMPDKLHSMSEKILQIVDNETGHSDTLTIKYLSEIITSRAREIIEAILFKIQESGFSERLRSGIVLTGGCANLPNLSNLFKEMSGYNVRIGYPRRGKIIAGNCQSIVETNAVASVGMIIEAAADSRLNCTSEIEVEEKEEAKKLEEVPEYINTDLFGNATEEKVETKKPVSPKGSRSTRENKFKEHLTWTKKIGDVFGSLFDDMEQ